MPALDFSEAAFNPIRLGVGQKREGQTEGEYPHCKCFTSTTLDDIYYGNCKLQAQWHIFEHLRYYRLKTPWNKNNLFTLPNWLFINFSFLPLMYEVSLHSQKPCGVFWALIWTVTCLFSELTAGSKEKCSPLVFYIM